MRVMGCNPKDDPRLHRRMRLDGATPRTSYTLHGSLGLRIVESRPAFARDRVGATPSWRLSPAPVHPLQEPRMPSPRASSPVLVAGSACRCVCATQWTFWPFARPRPCLRRHAMLPPSAGSERGYQGDQGPHLFREEHPEDHGGHEAGGGS